MLAKCANPICSSIFRYLDEGKLFRVENGQVQTGEYKRQVEYFWLCPACSEKMTLHLSEEKTVTTISALTATEAAPDGTRFIPLERNQDRLLSWLAYRE